MTGFSADWLALREAADHRSRNLALAHHLSTRFSGTIPVRVMDFGCGTGSNLRATAPFLGPIQDWVLIDYDPSLLAAAQQALAEWAESARADEDRLVLKKAGRTLHVTFKISDLNRDLEKLLAARPDLVTASALFDLISPEWIARFAPVLKRSGAAFYTVLTYDGRDAFTPPHPADPAVIDAFARHQASDKGFGIAAGPQATEILAQSLTAAGFQVETGDSPWRLGPEDQALVAALLPGIANAVRETGRVPEEQLQDWLRARLDHAKAPDSALITGHTDLFAS